MSLTPPPTAPAPWLMLPLFFVVCAGFDQSPLALVNIDDKEWYPLVLFLSLSRPHDAPCEERKRKDDRVQQQQLPRLD